MRYHAPVYSQVYVQIYFLTLTMIAPVQPKASKHDKLPAAAVQLHADTSLTLSAIGFLLRLHRPYIALTLFWQCQLTTLVTITRLLIPSRLERHVSLADQIHTVQRFNKVLRDLTKLHNIGVLTSRLPVNQQLVAWRQLSQCYTRSRSEDLLIAQAGLAAGRVCVRCAGLGDVLQEM